MNNIGGVPAKTNLGGRYGIGPYPYPDYVIHEDFTVVPGVDTIYQYLEIFPDDTDINITLDNAKAKSGDRFNFKQLGSGINRHALVIKDGRTLDTIDKVYARVIKEFIFDGKYWVGTNLGTHPLDNYEGIGIGENANPAECGVAIGRLTDGNQDGVAVGQNADGHAFGTAVGYNSDAINRGVALGGTAQADERGTALGYYCQTNLKEAAIAIGYRSKNSREAELAMNIGDPVDSDINKAYNQIVIGSWIRETTNNTPTTMRVNAGATTRFTIRAQSALIFKIMVTARDNTAGDCAAYLFDGLIKRDGANNTTLCVCNKTVLHEDDDTWDCDCLLYTSPSPRD